jgi:hypothetical protein
LYVTDYVATVGGTEATCIRASSSTNVTKIEINNTAASGRLWELRSTNGGNYEVVDRNAVSIRMWITNTGATYRASNSSTWDTISDVRLKKDVIPYDKGLAHLMRLQPITYKWCDDLKNKQLARHCETMISVNAQDLEKEFPECVVSVETEDYPDTRSINTHALQFAMLNAVRELGMRLAAVEADNVELRRQLDLLRDN